MYIYRVEDRIGKGYIPGGIQSSAGGPGGGRERADQVRAELNGNPVQSHGYRAGFSPPRAGRAAGGP